MGKFRNSKAKAVGKAVVLPNTGIEVNVIGIKARDFRDALRIFTESDEMEMLQSGNIVGLMDRGPNEIAKILLSACNEPQEQDDIDGILDLPLPDLKLLVVSVIDVSTEGKGFGDFFDGWAAETGLDGLFQKLREKGQEFEENTTNSEESYMAKALDPEAEALLSE